MIQTCVILYIIGCIINYNFIFIKYGVDNIKDAVSLVDDTEKIMKHFDILIKITIFLSWIPILIYLKKENQKNDV